MCPLPDELFCIPVVLNSGLSAGLPTMDAMDSPASSPVSGAVRKKKALPQGQGKFSIGRTTKPFKATSTLTNSAETTSSHSREQATANKPTQRSLSTFEALTFTFSSSRTRSKRKLRAKAAPVPSRAQIQALKQAKKLKEDRQQLSASTPSGVRMILPNPVQAAEILKNERVDPKVPENILENMQLLQKELSDLKKVTTPYDQNTESAGELPQPDPDSTP